MDYIAHVRKDGEGWALHALGEHLRGAAYRAERWAALLGAGEWARLAGLWHDLGKYAPQFQSMIRRESGYDPEEEIVVGPRNHSTAGALHAVGQLGNAGRVLAYLIAGHHAGLPDWYGDGNAAAALSARLRDRLHLDVLPQADIPADILSPGIKPATRMPGANDDERMLGAHLWLRMLFSCLVDADFLDTEAFMSPEQAVRRVAEELDDTLLVRFEQHMAVRFGAAQPNPVNRVRADVLRQCREKAHLAPGLFSLTVPTGGGKTLASMAFALHHAQAHNKRRIIYAIPFTSIIDQTATIFREILSDAVIEHHSSLDPEKESVQSRLATENWAAPIVVTTNVQLFESLFAARTSRCRKLHNLTNSVIVLDEAQTLPPELLQPCLDMLNLLTKHYSVSVVLCTATQPALRDVASFGRALRGLDNVREIIDAPQALFDDLRRVQVHLPADFHARENWDTIAAKVGTGETALAIVNTRKDCRELWQHLRQSDNDAIHLSASMCGAHRAQRIDEIRCRLKAGEPTLVVSTQLIEAGVDVDFPVVWRALAGLDSIAQAAGRCNREGMLVEGQVHVFVPPKPAPSGLLRQAEQATVSLMSGDPLDPLAPATFERYFRQFYLNGVASWGDEEICKPLTQDACELKIQFRTVAERFRFINDEDSLPILVWWDDSRSLIGKLEKNGPERLLMRKLQRYSVNLPRRDVMRLQETGEVREIRPGIFAQDVHTLYDRELGVVMENGTPIVF